MMGHTRAVPPEPMTDSALIAMIGESNLNSFGVPIQTVIDAVGKRRMNALVKAGKIEVHPVAYRPLRALVYLCGETLEAAYAARKAKP